MPPPTKPSVQAHVHPPLANPSPRLFAQIELKVRKQNTISRQLIIDSIVSCVPSGWTVDLDDAKVFFPTVFKVQSLFVDGTHT